MTEGTRLLSVSLTGGATEEIKYLGGDVLDIMNGASGDLKVGFDAEFESGYITISEGGFYNGLKVIGSIFAESEGGGTVSIVRR